MIMNIVYCLTSYWNDAADESTRSYPLAKINISYLLPFLFIEYLFFKYLSGNYTRNMRDNNFQVLKLIINSLFAVMNITCTLMIVNNFSILYLLYQVFFLYGNNFQITTDSKEDKLSTSKYFTFS